MMRRLTILILLTNVEGYLSKSIELNKAWRDDLFNECSSITKFSDKIGKENKKCVARNIECKEAAGRTGAHIFECYEYL